MDMGKNMVKDKLFALSLVRFSCEIVSADGKASHQIPFWGISLRSV